MKKLFLFCCLTYLAISRLSAQGIPSEGKDFYLGYIHPSYNDVVPPQSASYFRVYAYVSSFQSNTVSVSYFDPLSKKEDYPYNFSINARQTTQIALDRTRMQMTNQGDIAGEFKSCHLTSKKPINVQFFSTGANSGGSYLALPVNAWGKQYVVASYNDNGLAKGGVISSSGPTVLDKAAGVFLIIAAYDGTQVTITPTALTGGGNKGVYQGAGATGTPQPYTVGLNRGQCWMVKSKSAAIDGEDDISASIVKADKPVAVIAGHENAMTGNGSTGGRTIEGRDFMIEQMIPVEYWDNTGYITIPMSDSPGSNGTGLGEDIRVFVSDEQAPTTVSVNDGALTFLGNLAPYKQPGEYTNVTTPAHLYSNTGKFMVMQYDLRNHGIAVPYPTPSMMSIVPRSRWRNAYLWYAPSNVSEGLQAYYVTIIAIKDGVPRYHEPSDSVLTRNWFSDSILVSKNGSQTFGKISALGTPKHAWDDIPGHPDLKAVIYQISPGTSFYAKSLYPFMAYFIGDRAVTPDGHLGESPNDYFFSFATPLGMALGNAVPKRIGITVDTLCSGWRVCVHDSNNAGGIKSVTLIDDPNGDIIVGGRYQYKNTSFEPKDDPLNLKEIVLNPPKTDFCFTVRIDNPGADAYAPLYVVDVNGNGKVVELRYKKAVVEFNPPDTVGLVLQPWLDSITKKIYSYSYIGEEICKDYLFINKTTSSKTYKLAKVDIPQPSNFKVTNVMPGIGSAVKPGDTVRITACFTGPDTMRYLDSIEFETDCFSTRLPLIGQAGTPLIIAEDYDFGTILVGTKKCHDVEVKNVGNKPFTLDSNWVLSNGSDFSFDVTKAQNKLPRTLGPGQSWKFWLCYTATDEGFDSARMDWSTDIREPYDREIKPYSEFRGAGIKPGVNWDRPTQEFRADSTGAFYRRVNLVNSSTADAQLTRIWIDGPDADEFKVVATEFNTNPPTYAGTVLTVGDTMWVDLAFKLDMTKLPIDRHRTAFLRTSTTLDTVSIPTIALSAGFDLASVKVAESPFELRIRPNPARDKIRIELTLDNASDVSVAIYDVLGNTKLMRTFKAQQAGANAYTLNLQGLVAGSYIVVARAGESSEAKQIVIE